MAMMEVSSRDLRNCCVSMALLSELVIRLVAVLIISVDRSFLHGTESSWVMLLKIFHWQIFKRNVILQLELIVMHLYPVTSDARSLLYLT